jgi:hypothetical protein
MARRRRNGGGGGINANTLLMLGGGAALIYYLTSKPSTNVNTLARQALPAAVKQAQAGVPIPQAAVNAVTSLFNSLFGSGTKAPATPTPTTYIAPTAPTSTPDQEYGYVPPEETPAPEAPVSTPDQEYAYSEN